MLPLSNGTFTEAAKLSASEGSAERVCTKQSRSLDTLRSRTLSNMKGGTLPVNCTKITVPN